MTLRMSGPSHPFLLGDVISLGAIAGTVTHLLPPVAAFLAIIWYLVEIFESRTLQSFLRGRRLRHHRRKRVIRKVFRPQTKTPPDGG